ncbi:MAG: leucine-rich repeat protein [Eubacterium sp.]|nr:leucine-rich repeat protein [Eubacterium sp.]
MKKTISVLLAAIMTLSVFTAFPSGALAAGSGKCGENVNYVFTAGVLTISGTGDMYDYTEPAFTTPGIFKNVIVQEGVTSVGSYFFANYDGIENVTLPESLTKVGNNAFDGITTVNSVTFGGTKTEFLNALGDNNGGLTKEGITYNFGKVQLSFNLNGGEGTIETVKGAAPLTVALPECNFAKADRTFYKWQVGDEMKYPEAEVTVNEDTVAKALWVHNNYTEVSFANDESKAIINGSITLKSGGKTLFTKDLNNTTVPGRYDDLDNAQVLTAIGTMESSLKAFVNQYSSMIKVKDLKVNVSQPTTIQDYDNRTYSYANGYDEGLDSRLPKTDNNGDFYKYHIANGDCAKQVSYNVVLSADVSMNNMGGNTPINMGGMTGGKSGNVSIPEMKLEGMSSNIADKYITSVSNDKDPKGTKFSNLFGKQKKVTKNAITVSWKKKSGAKYYVIYGNKCGNSNKYKKLARVTGNTYTQKKLKKGTYYKYLICAFDKNNKLIANSNTLHIATLGGKNGNFKSVKTAAKKNKVTLAKKGKKFKLKAKGVPANKKLKVANHRAIKYESSNTKVATVNSKGVITAKKKGSCKVYVYAQNGVYKTIKVKVKK